MISRAAICSLALCAVLAGCGPDAPAPDVLATEASTVCDPATCPGCCQGSVCQPGNTVAACGTGATACVLCQPKEVCTEGQCVAEGAKCTPITCPKGCCQDDQCQAGTAREACGKGGQRCVTCSSTQACVNQVCGCSTATCKGCCEVGFCRPGTTSLLCGTGGQVCKKCGSTEGCVAGVCKSGGSCSAASCTGCCDGTICKGGGAKDACGLNGQPCKICGATEVCAAGTCNDAQLCGPSTCASGCCQASKCLAGSSATACGKGGGLCAACVSPRICQAGGCVLDPASMWGITVVKAEIDSSKGWDWPFYTAPDPLVVIEVAGQKGNTSALQETYAPEWNEYLFSVSAGTLISTPLLITVYDDDFPTDQQMGQCQAIVTEAVLLAGGGIVEGCGADVKKIEIKLVLQ